LCFSAIRGDGGVGIAGGDRLRVRTVVLRDEEFRERRRVFGDDIDGPLLLSSQGSQISRFSAVLTVTRGNRRRSAPPVELARHLRLGESGGAHKETDGRAP